MNEDSLIFDLETTSVNVSATRPVQIGLAGHLGGELRVLMNSLVNPMTEIEQGASDVHHITEEMVRSAPDYLIGMWQVSLLAQALRPAYVVTYNGSVFDLPIANRLIPGVFGQAKSVDVLDVAYRYFPTLTGHLGGKKLVELYRIFLNKDLEGAHDAVADLRATWEVLRAMQAKIGMTLSQLADDLAVPKPYSVCPIGKYRGTTIESMPRSWAKFMADKDLRPDLKATVDWILTH